MTDSLGVSSADRVMPVDPMFHAEGARRDVDTLREHLAEAPAS